MFGSIVETIEFWNYFLDLILYLIYKYLERVIFLINSLVVRNL